MKNLITFLLFTTVLGACSKLDLNPPSEPSTGGFYSNQAELELAVNDLYRLAFWGNDDEFFTDNDVYRTFGNAVVNGTMNSEDATVRTFWLNSYKAIARANTFLANKDRAAANTPASVMTRLEAEMRLIRAYEYSRLITHFGDVPLVTGPLLLEESYGIKRTARQEVLNFVFGELDFAANNLPVSYTTASVKRLTKGVAFAIKARTALYLKSFAIAKAASDSIIKLAATGTYSLHPSYSQLFLKDGELSKEIIYSVPKDEKQKVFNGAEGWVKEHMSRNAGGYGAYFPSWDILNAYECTDGKPIDESALYDPLQPFRNRDPRLTASIVEFGTSWLGFSYQPHPDSLRVRNFKTGALVTNNDSRGVATFASFTGMLWKKGIDQTWADRLVEDNDLILVRYAEMLLTYAEAKIELGEVDASVLNAINQVRARAYGVSVGATTLYPAITTLVAADLRKIVRRERRVEFVKEGLRYMDLIRWQLAEKALAKPVVGLPDPASQNRARWPFAAVAQLDDDGVSDYTDFGTNIKILIERKFDKSRQYLWPIPAVETRVNTGISQNPGY